MLPQPREELVLDRFNWLYLHPTVTSIYLGLAVVLLVGYLGRRHLPDRVWPVPAYIVLLAAHARGLVGYWRTPGVLRTPQGRAAVGLGDDERFVALIHLGHPVQEKQPPDREPAESVTEYLE